jgi:hypothetical protein
MEDVLEVYQRPHDPECPLVCLDETSKQLIAEARVPIPVKPGHPVRHDHEYERNGTANLFMMFAPLEGWRHVEITDRHTAIDYAKVLKDLSDTHFRKAKKITLVQDNLNIHKPASLYEAFPAAEARRLVERFEWHYTPKHGSWLNMAESELSVLSGQCLDRLALRGIGNDGGDQRGKVFLCVSWASPSACGWRGRTEMWLKVNVFRIRPTLRSSITTKKRANIRSRRSHNRQRTTPSSARSGPC